MFTYICNILRKSQNQFYLLTTIDIISPIILVAILIIKKSFEYITLILNIDKHRLCKTNNVKLINVELHSFING